MRKEHILVVSQYFYPENFRINDICAEWVKKGYKVTVVTGIPNYPQGKFYKGYGWFKRRKETWNGVDIIRIPLVSRGKSSIRLALNYFSFVISGWFWKLFTRVKADIVFTFEVSPMTQALVGVWYAKRRKIPHYLYVQDLWPENVEIVTGIKSKAILNPISKMVNSIYKRSDKIFATSPAFVTEIQKRVFDNKEKVVYWPQYAEEFYTPTEKNLLVEIPENDAFKIMFTGNVGQAQGLDILPKTARILQDRRVNVQFVIIGDGRDKENLQKQIVENDVEKLFLLVDRQSAERIPAFLAHADMAFVSFMDNPLFENTIPAKLQSYMACGAPILAAAKGETQRVIEEADCGVCSPIGDATALADAIAECMKNPRLKEMGENAKKYSETHFNKQALLNQMDGYLQEEIV